MDSLTQLTLGAACGEMVLGKKVGNRAMIWGAIGGTIPDLDIFANFVTDEMTALAWHRGFSHSITFAVLAPIVFGWMTYKLYDSGFYKRKGFKIFALLASMVFYSLIAVGITFAPTAAGGSINPMTAGVCTIFGLALLMWLWRNYYSVDQHVESVSWYSWGLLFFWSIFTHPLLDCCTAYGTQLFQPFSDYRVAFNNISVVDPIYTLPFLICVLLASFYFRTHPKRRFFNYLGLALSSLYLIFTFYQKVKVDRIFETSLKDQNVPYHRYMTQPTIFNNVLWMGMAEGDSAFYFSLYSILDKEAKFSPVKVLEKNHDLISKYENDRSIKILKWFSDHYYNITIRPDGKMQFNNLRFGMRGSEETGYNYIFGFSLEEKNGIIDAHHERDMDSIKEDIGKMWWRLKGL